MPTFGCIVHEKIFTGESGPFLKKSNKKIKKETVENLRKRGLSGKYSNFVRQKCVSWVETEGNYIKKRTFTEGLTADCINNIQKCVFSKENLIQIAIGTNISDNVYGASVNMCMKYVNPEQILNFD